MSFVRFKPRPPQYENSRHEIGLTGISEKMNFSLEITMKTELSVLPKVKDVYITMLPGNDFREVAKKA